jgi:hypothetical protein
MLSAEQIQSNWDKHLKIVDTYISEVRKPPVVEMLQSLKEFFIMAPASGKEWYHNAFPGGYIDHVNRVVEAAFRVSELWEKMGGNIDFEYEELVLSALFHDLGKIGDGNLENYIPQTDNWRREKLKEVYSINSKLDFMLIPDRSLFILQNFGIKLTQKEYIAIKIHDGLYEDVNKPYFISNNPDTQLRSNLPYILSQADLMASKIECNMWDNFKNKKNTN